MIAYTEDKKRYNLDTDNFIDEGEYGRVYLTSNNKCLKIFKQSHCIGITNRLSLK